MYYMNTHTFLLLFKPDALQLHLMFLDFPNRILQFSFTAPPNSLPLNTGNCPYGTLAGSLTPHLILEQKISGFQSQPVTYTCEQKAMNYSIQNLVLEPEPNPFMSSTYAALLPLLYQITLNKLWKHPEFKEMPMKTHRHREEKATETPLAGPWG